MTINQNKGCCLWFTGLPCAGKTTIANALAKILKDEGHKVERLDGDIVRKNLTKDLGFSKEDRNTNIERNVFVAKLLARNDIIVLSSFITPYISARDYARKEIFNFIEVFVKCPVEVCIERDVKGMYKKALAGEIKNFTGIDDPYENPVNAEIIVETDKESVDESVEKILNYLRNRELLD